MPGSNTRSGQQSRWGGCTHLGGGHGGVASRAVEGGRETQMVISPWWCVGSVRADGWAWWCLSRHYHPTWSVPHLPPTPLGH